MREAIIYGIREVGTETIVYVGQTVDLGRRRRGAYSPVVTKWLATHAHEFIELSRVPVALAAAEEQATINSLSASGATLLNAHPATPSTACRNGGNRVETDRRILSASPEQWALWREQAQSYGLTLSAWLRLAADRQAERRTLG